MIPLDQAEAQLRTIAFDKVGAITLDERDEAISTLDRILVKSFGRCVENLWPSLIKVSDNVKKRLAQWPLIEADSQTAMQREVDRILHDVYHIDELENQWAEDSKLQADAFRYADFIFHTHWTLSDPLYRGPEPSPGCSKCKDSWDEWISRSKPKTKRLTDSEKAKALDLFEAEKGKYGIVATPLSGWKRRKEK